MIVKLIAIVNSVACVVQPVVIKITNNFLIVVKVNPRLMSSPASTASMVQLQPPLSSKLVTSIKVETLTNLRSSKDVRLSSLKLISNGLKPASITAGLLLRQNFGFVNLCLKFFVKHFLPQDQKCTHTFYMSHIQPGRCLML